jgi:hypothetical protein
MSHADRTLGSGWGSDLQKCECLKTEGRRFDPAPDHRFSGHPLASHLQKPREESESDGEPCGLANQDPHKKPQLQRVEASRPGRAGARSCAERGRH